MQFLRETLKPFKIAVATGTPLRVHAHTLHKMIKQVLCNIHQTCACTNNICTYTCGGASHLCMCTDLGLGSVSGVWVWGLCLGSGTGVCVWGLGLGSGYLHVYAYTMACLRTL